MHFPDYLAEGYLRRKILPPGIYPVAWFDLPASKTKWTTYEAVQQDCAKWAEAASTSSRQVRGFALDCRWKDMELPGKLPEVG